MIGLPIETLNLLETPVDNLEPLTRLPLVDLHCAYRTEFKPVRRRIPSLRKINQSELSLWLNPAPDPG